MMDGRMRGRRDEGPEWESWELAGMTLLLFSFNSSFAHHVFRCRQKQFVLSVFPSPSSPLPPSAFESFSSWAQFCSCRVRVSVCMVMSTSVLRVCVFVVLHTHTRMQQPQDLDQFSVEKRGVSLRQDIWKWAFCSRQRLHSDLIILSCWGMCAWFSGVCVICVCTHTQITHCGCIYTPTR